MGCLCILECMRISGYDFEHYIQHLFHMNLGKDLYIFLECRLGHWSIRNWKYILVGNLAVYQCMMGDKNMMVIYLSLCILNTDRKGMERSNLLEMA